MRLVLMAALIALCTPASAGQTLNLDGSFGRNGSCGIPAGNYPDTDNYAYLTSSEFRGAEWFCSFVWANEDVAGARSTFYEQVFTVIAQCYAEGEPFSRLLTIQRREDEVIVTNATEVDKYDALSRCPQ